MWWTQNKSIRMLQSDHLRHPVNVNITEPLMNPPKASASNMSENEKDFDWLIAAAGRTVEPADQWGGCGRWSASEADTLSPSIELIHLIKVRLASGTYLFLKYCYLRALECSIDELE